MGRWSRLTKGRRAAFETKKHGGERRDAVEPIRRDHLAPVILARPTGALVPKLIADAGESAPLRFLDFFTANPQLRRLRRRRERSFAWLDEIPAHLNWLSSYVA